MEQKTFSMHTPPQKRQTGLNFWVKWSLLTFLFFLLVGAGAVGGTIYYFSRNLPSLGNLGTYEPSLATRIYSDDNKVIGQFFIEKRVFVPLSQMPKVLINAFLAVEDSRFYQHKGFDTLRIMKAFIRNVESMKIRQGASTITQQLARSLFLTPERTLTRKLKELLMARKMEKAIEKDRILEIYLNQIYFGHGSYGVQIAAKTYFGKNVREINLAEAAFLAGLPKAPNHYSPYRHPEKAKFRQRVVLKRMESEGYITKQEYREIYAEDLYFQKRHSRKDDIALYFKEHIRQYLIGKYGDEVLYRGGLNVYTTLNVPFQRMAERALRDGLEQLDKRQGYRGAIGTYSAETEEASLTKKKPQSLKVGEIVNGRVLSRTDHYAKVEVGDVVGKILLKDMLWAARQLKGEHLRDDRVIIKNPKPYDIVNLNDIILVKVKQVGLEGEDILFGLEQKPLVQGAFIALDPSTGAVKALVGGYDFRKSEFNRALMARRQPGSAFKPIIYGTAIEQGFTPATLLVDNPVIFTDSETNKVWKPENYEKKFYGQITMRDALTHSRNLATVRLLKQVGIPNVVNFAQRVGIDTPLTRDLSLALGSSGISLMEITSALGVYANQGVRLKPTLILSVTDKDGRVLESHEFSPEQAISKETAYVVTNILEDVIQRGTGRRARVIGRPIAGKTGTTNEFTDAWFVGFTPNLAAGVWVGFDDNRSLGNRESGGRAALPVWVSFMKNSLSLLPVVSFSIPEKIVYARIDRDTGLLVSEDEDGEVEIFVKGTEPREFKMAASSPNQFFRFDGGGAF
ncbi:MAG: PBP1A family penicillin-binding protein [Nitrospira sp.]|nr:PBP1A family penicillin-binding protein [Candidatus Manganitrophaceae bacterium]HIL34129.1 PBP1A family penicillin-binding protein [Candidatus Manganitrophaceae bacterium]